MSVQRFKVRFSSAAIDDLRAIARQLGFEVHEQKALDFLVRGDNGYDMIVMLDIIEHFTREELFPLLREVYRKLRTGGRLILSVPNAESPTGPGCV
ncbi:MAG: class I SAM-dependent methyltransferase, partial [Hyphomonas sp.]